MKNFILCALVFLCAKLDAQPLLDARRALAAEDAYRALFYVRRYRPQNPADQFAYNNIKLESALLNRASRADSIELLVDANKSILRRKVAVSKSERDNFSMLSAWSLQIAGSGKEAYARLDSLKDITGIIGATVLYRKADIERNTLRKFDLAEQHLIASIQLYKNDSALYHFKIYRCRLLLGLTYRDKSDFERAELNYRMALALLDAMPEPRYDERAKVLNNLGNLYRNDYKRAKDLYEQSLKIRREFVKDSTALANAYTNLGVFYFNFGDFISAQSNYSQAINYSRIGTLAYNQLVYNYSILLNEFYQYSDSKLLVRNAIETRLNTLPSSHVANVRLRLRLVQSEAALGNHDEAERQLALVWRDLQEYSTDDILWVEYFEHKATTALINEDAPTMRSYADSALTIFEKVKSKDAVLYSNLLKRKADAELATNNIVGADSAYNNLYRQLITYQASNSTAVVNCQISLGEVNLINHKYDSAITHLQRALVDISASKQKAATETMMANKFLAKTYYQKYLNTSSVADLNAAAIHIDQSIHVIMQMKTRMNSEVDRMTYGKNMFDDFRLGVDIYYKQYQLNQTEQSVSKMFEVMELSKAQLLIGSIKTQKVNSFAKVTNDILDYEKKMDERTNMLRRNLDLLMGRSDREGEIENSISQELQQLEARKASFIDSLQRHLPDYYSLKYDQTLVSLEQLKDHLKKNPKDGVVMFGAGQTEMYGLLVTATGTSVYTCGQVDDITRQSRLFRTLIRTQSIKPLDTLSARFYRTLVLPAKSLMDKNKINNLTIIPEDALTSIPFETFVSGKKKTSRSEYLLERYELTYSYSATLHWQQETDLKKAAESRGFLGLAPAFSNNRRVESAITRDDDQFSYDDFHFSDLPGALQEVSDIGKTFNKHKQNVTTLIGEDATEHAFREAIRSQPSFIHLATHGFASDGRGGQAGVAFYAENDDNDDGLLLTNEVYGLSIPAELAVLSACETGLGKYYNGEGMIGLTRAFIYAGVQSVMVSLWKVEDKTTAALMTSFYDELINKKNTRAGAVRKAKIGMIENGYHPYYWSPFILVGLK